MRMKKAIIPVLLAYAILSLACRYIVLPEGFEASGADGKEETGWGAVATTVEETDSGNLKIGISIRNDTGDWSAMEAIDGKPATLTSGGESLNCETTFVSTGGHRLAPGFQMNGYTAGTKSDPETQPITVECTSAKVKPGTTLSIPYSYVTGQYNYYEQDKNKVDGSLEIKLDDIITDLEYPIAEQIDGLIQQPELEIVAINKVQLTLTEVQRTENGLEFSWKTYNPGDYPTYVHIGNPPVICHDGVYYGFYETPDIVSAPITPAGGTAEWTTQVGVPQNVTGCYIMLSVETGKARLFANYAIDITDQ